MNDKPADVTFDAIVASLTENIDADTKATLDSLLTGNESAAEKIKIILNGDFVNNPEIIKVVKEFYIDYIGREDV